MGFYVKAAVDIPANTLLCEYVGEVRTLRDTLRSKNDSIYNLLEVKELNSKCKDDEEKSLCIVTEEHANMGRFFNSVITNEKRWKRKQNVVASRSSICGKASVLMVTKRDVKEGESLLINYNESQQLYPTFGFK